MIDSQSKHVTHPSLPTYKNVEHLSHGDAWGIQTISRRAVNVVSMSENDINIKDIARGLSNIGRFGGQTGTTENHRTISVGIHSILVCYEMQHRIKDCGWSRVETAGLMMAALLHDAPEACTGIDAPAPVKARILIDTGDDIISLRELEDRLGRTIFRKYGVEQFLHHPLIKECDRAICRLEMEDGCERYDAPSNYPRSLSHTFIPIMEAQCVENWFLNMFATLENDLVEQST